MSPQRSGPLAGLKVIELGGIGPVPFAGMYLADLGAQVLRVDRQDSGFAMPIPEELDTLHRGKQRITIDLKHPQGAEAVLRLAETADVVLESYRPGVAERLGVGPEECRGRNPRLVYGRMTGWGQEGPMSQRAGHDPTYIAMTGALHAIGRADGPPQLPLNLVGDFGGGAMYLVAGVLAALWEASRSGRGQVIDSAIVDGAAHLMASNYALLNGGAWSDRRGENLVDSGTPFVDVYETLDGKHVAVAALEPQFYAQLLTGLGLDRDSLPRQWDRDGWPLLRRTFAATFCAGTRDHWEKTFQDTDACVAPILSMTEAPHSVHLQRRRTFIERDGRFEPAPAPRFSRTVPADPEAPVAAGAVPPETVLAHWGVRGSEEILTGGAIIKAASSAK